MNSQNNTATGTAVDTYKEEFLLFNMNGRLSPYWGNVCSEVNIVDPMENEEYSIEAEDDSDYPYRGMEPRYAWEESEISFWLDGEPYAKVSLLGREGYATFEVYEHLRAVEYRQKEKAFKKHQRRKLVAAAMELQAFFNAKETGDIYPVDPYEG